MRLTLMFVTFLGLATLGAAWAQTPKPKPSDPLAAVRKQLKQSQAQPQPIKKVYRDNKPATDKLPNDAFHPMSYTPAIPKR